MRLSDTSYLPKLRQGLYALVVVAALLDALLVLSLLGYQLRWTTGYNKPVPALFTCATLTILVCGFLLAPVKPDAGRTRRLLASVQVELVLLAGLALFTLACVSRLHAATPGLLSFCGRFVVCSLLQGCVSLAWISFLFICLLFATLLLASLYHRRRTPHASVFRQPFSAIDWAIYAPYRSVRLPGPGGRAGRAVADEGDRRFTIGEDDERSAAGDKR